jgi:D-glycero-alpha-D-manno-heptose 1-phosphate guanylyltransferase
MSASSHPLDMLILCGGKGTRLGSVTKDTPKPLLPLGGSPFLLRLLMQWHQEGIQRFVLSVCHLAEQFYEFAKKHASKLGKIEVICEDEPLGTGGGLKFASQAIKTDSFFVANGDSYVSESLQHILQFHQKNSSSFSLLAIPANHVLGSARQKGNLAIGKNQELVNFKTREETAEGWVNGGVYLIDRAHIQSWPTGKYDLEKNIFEQSTKYPVKIYQSQAKLMDIGRPDCYPLFDQKLGSIDQLFSKLDV